MANVTIQQALQNVVDHPDFGTDDLLALPAHELICRTLFDIANNAALADKKSMAAANTARTLIFQRLVGKRRAGSHPATRTRQQLVFKDLQGNGGDDGE